MHSSDFLSGLFQNQPALAMVALAALSAGANTASGAEEGAAVKTIKDVAYYEGPDAHKSKLKLDLFLPEGKKDFPVVLFVHGGAWLHGDKSFMGFYSALGASLARQGIGCVVTNYRLSPAVKHP